MVLISNLAGSIDRFEPFNAFALFTNIDKNGLSVVQNEAVSVVHGLDGHIDLSDSDVSGAFDLEQSLYKSILVDVAEAGLDAPWKISDTILETR